MLSGLGLCITLYVMPTILTLRLPGALKRELARLSKRHNRPASDLAREALRRYIAVERFRALRERSVTIAEKRGFLSDEDVFKAVS